MEKLLAQTSTPAIRRSGNPDDVLRIGNMDTHKRALENDTVDTTKMLRLIIQTKRRYKKDRETKRPDQRRKDTNDLSTIGDESEDGKAPSLTTTRTATYLLRTTPMKKLTRQRLKKKNGSNT